MEFRWPDGSVTAAMLEDSEPERRLSFRWMPFVRLPGGGFARRDRARVEITLERVPGGTLLRVVEASLVTV
jgi:hypothetical protein